jgi:CheY-like chemotaxis protein
MNRLSMSTEPTDTAPLVLLVDDDEDSRVLYAEYLTAVSGYRVVEAADGREAIELAGANAPAAIVMDVSLPVLDGKEAMRVLRKSEKTSRIPIVALSGYTNVRDANDPETEFQVVLVKPCLPDALAKAIESVLRR